ncbi:MAG: HD domain-containing protein [Gammaproteobacteria bacterium]|nr:MAG: HD domain-containing protein [Gammaproteobacteria bacterium]
MATIVIVDDQLTSRQVLVQLVSSMDGEFDVQSFANPVEGLNWCVRNPVDLILTDYKMPEMNGVEFIQKFRGYSSCEHIPIIMVTSIEDMNIRYEALGAGATDFLMKPVDHHECRARCRNLLTQHQQYKIIRDRSRWLERRVAEATSEIRLRERETLIRLAKAGEYRDEDTGNHVIRMAKYSRIIAETIGFSPEEANVIEMAAPMHDIGKIGIRDEILLKPGRLTAGEFEVMKDHTRIGYEILKDSPSKFLQMGAVIALGHHEKFDGTGYPFGKQGDDIPIEARIVAVADVYDALVSERPYKHAWPMEAALEYMEGQRGKHFDPQCLDAFKSQVDDVCRTQMPQIVKHAIYFKQTPKPDITQD